MKKITKRKIVKGLAICLLATPLAAGGLCLYQAQQHVPEAKAMVEKLNAELGPDARLSILDSARKGLFGTQIDYSLQLGPQTDPTTIYFTQHLSAGLSGTDFTAGVKPESFGTLKALGIEEGAMMKAAGRVSLTGDEHFVLAVPPIVQPLDSLTSVKAGPSTIDVSFEKGTGLMGITIFNAGIEFSALGARVFETGKGLIESVWRVQDETVLLDYFTAMVDSVLLPGNDENRVEIESPIVSFKVGDDQSSLAFSASADAVAIDNLRSGKISSKLVFLRISMEELVALLNALESGDAERFDSAARSMVDNKPTAYADVKMDTGKGESSFSSVINVINPSSFLAPLMSEENLRSLSGGAVLAIDDRSLVDLSALLAKLKMQDETTIRSFLVEVVNSSPFLKKTGKGYEAKAELRDGELRVNDLLVF